MQKGYLDVETPGSEGVKLAITIQGEAVAVPDASFIRDAQFLKDGADLVLHGPQGKLVVENYFAADMPPLITAADGSTLTSSLVQSFLSSGTQYAQAHSLNDVSPVGSISEVSGHVTVTRIDGTTETVTIGTPIYERDIVETFENGAANIVFIDETSFAISENGRLAIDEYAFNPATNEGTTGFSILKGIFVFTSGLIGRADPDDVTLETPMGSIGIRGTIIAGNLGTGEITVLEGAIVLRNFSGHEVTLADQYETARFNTDTGTIEPLGLITPEALSASFSSLSSVSGTLFSSVGDTRQDAHPEGETLQNPAEPPASESRTEEKPPESTKENSHENSHEAPAEKQGQADPQSKPQSTAEIEKPSLDKSINAAQDHADEQQAKLTTKMGVEIAKDKPATLSDPAPPATTQQAQPPAPTTTRLDSPDTNYVPQQPPQPVDHVPTHGRDMPGEYFALIKDPGRSFAYNFSQEFSDPEGAPLTYSLSGNQNIDGVDIQLNATTGLLTMTLGADLSTLPTDMSIQVIASDGVNQTVAAPITFQFLESDSDLQQGPPFGDGNFNNPAEQILMESNHQEIGDAGANKTVFLKATQENDFKMQGDSNVIYVGENSSNRTVLLEEQATGNTVFGGSHNETFEIKNANNAVYGLDGNDTAVLHLDKTNPADLGNLEIDLGGEDEGFWAWGKAFAAGAQAYLDQVALENKGTFGDTLVLRGDGGSLDFSNVGKLRGLETLDLKTDNGSQLVTLTVKDIFSSTDDFNTLVIRGDASDTVHLDTQGGGSTFLEQVTIEGETYDAYSAHNSDGQAVTLLIDADIGTINGL